MVSYNMLLYNRHYISVSLRHFLFYRDTFKEKFKGSQLQNADITPMIQILTCVFAIITLLKTSRWVHTDVMGRWTSGVNCSLCCFRKVNREVEKQPNIRVSVLICFLRKKDTLI
jgi:hypothetical protein